MHIKHLYTCVSTYAHTNTTKEKKCGIILCDSEEAKQRQRYLIDNESSNNNNNNNKLFIFILFRGHDHRALAIRNIKY